MEHIKVYLLDSKAEVQYGLNWGHRDNRDKNQSYLQLLPEVYNGDFFPISGKYFVAKTDDKKTIIFNRAQKGKGTALQTPESNALLGLYLRQRMGLLSEAEISREDILKYGKLDIDFYKADEDLTYFMAFNKNWKSLDILYIYKQFLMISEKCKRWEEVNSEIEEIKKYSQFVFNFNDEENEVIHISLIDDYLKLLHDNKQLYEKFIKENEANTSLSSFLLFLKKDFFNLHYGQDLFLYKDNINMITDSQKLQQIFYGAPGTGKSDTIKREVDNKKQIHYRTTFHPDSDYSTFVGAYKPSMDGPHNIKLDMSFDDLASKLSEYYNDPDSGKIEGIQMFCKEFYRYIDGEFMAVSYDKLVKKAGISDNYAREIDKYVNFMHLMPKHNEKRIIYSFVPQAFTDAYIAAWNTEQPVFLIIEEINRGNCAQIFGDLFQLLDRKNGFSEYPIKADTDLACYLSDKFGKSPRKDIPDEVKKGEWLMLPSNLYIWATMNTSDQSLFPIDSAFKRRWEWRYIKIANGYRKDKNGDYLVDEEGKKIPLGWKLEINNQDWWEFIQQINTIISSMTMSADKQLGYFFCKADDNGIISKEVFVNKVLFYLWNDVFKDYAEEDSSLFKYKVNPEDKDFADLTFPDFFKEDGKIEESAVEQFVNNVMNWKKDEQTKQDS